MRLLCVEGCKASGNAGTILLWSFNFLRYFFFCISRSFLIIPTFHTIGYSQLNVYAS
jgi:hypothetical protein